MAIGVLLALVAGLSVAGVAYGVALSCVTTICFARTRSASTSIRSLPGWTS